MISPNLADRPDKNLRVAFLASRGGSAMAATLEAVHARQLDVTPCLLIASNPKARALVIAEQFGLTSRVLDRRDVESDELLDEKVCEALLDARTDYILLSGYLRKLGAKTLHTFQDRILNVHPALLPKYGGKGMYGDHVHRAVLDSGEKTTGATVHLVDGEYDHGAILQQRSIRIEPNDTLPDVRARVQASEIDLVIEVLRRLAAERQL